MNNLLTSQDLLRMEFKKSMRGYDTAEVDQFLDNIAETLQRYAERTKNLEQEVLKDKERLEEFEKMREVMHDTLLMAQKSADEKIAEAGKEAEKIIAAAMAKAENIRQDSYAENKQLCDELARIKDVRNQYMTEARGMIARFDELLCKCAEPTETSKQADEAIANCEPEEEITPKAEEIETKVRFEYEPEQKISSNPSAEETEPSNGEEFCLYDSEELIKADAEEQQPEKSEEELSAEQLARAEKTSFADENQSNLFGKDAEPMRLSKEIHYAEADDIDE